MGGRVSVPRGPGGTTESSRVPSTTVDTSPRTSGRKLPFNRRQLLVPVGATALGIIFYLYSRTSVQAAKENARRHREADGGSISWRNENLRRHGVLEKPKERGLMQQFLGGEDEGAKKKEGERLAALGRAKAGGSNAIEEGIRRAREGKVIQRDDDRGDE